MTESKAELSAKFVGKAISVLSTPALLLDLDRFNAALANMQQHAKKHNRALRPHGKSHKCSEIAKRQLAAGAIGVCCTKVSEALVFAKAGVKGTLITSPIVSASALETLKEVHRLDSQVLASV